MAENFDSSSTKLADRGSKKGSIQSNRLDLVEDARNETDVNENIQDGPKKSSDSEKVVSVTRFSNELQEESQNRRSSTQSERRLFKETQKSLQFTEDTIIKQSPDVEKNTLQSEEKRRSVDFKLNEEDKTSVPSEAAKNENEGAEGGPRSSREDSVFQRTSVASKGTRQSREDSVFQAITEEEREAKGSIQSEQRKSLEGKTEDDEEQEAPKEETEEFVPRYSRMDSMYQIMKAAEEEAEPSISSQPRESEEKRRESEDKRRESEEKRRESEEKRSVRVSLPENETPILEEVAATDGEEVAKEDSEIFKFDDEAETKELDVEQMFEKKSFTEIPPQDQVEAEETEPKPEDTESVSFASIMQILKPSSPSPSKDISFSETSTHQEPPPRGEPVAGSPTDSVNISEYFLAGTKRLPSTDTTSEYFVSEHFIKQKTSEVDMVTIAESEQAEVVTVKKEEKVIEDIPIDRKMYCEMYSLFEQRRNDEKRKNNYLQSRLAAYYMRRKMFYVLREASSRSEEAMAKYHKDLETLEQLCESSDREKKMNYDEVNHLTSKRDLTVTELQMLFENLQQIEQEYANGLTYDKTGRTNMDKLAERLIRRQKNQANNLVKLRLTYIQLRNKVSEKITALEELDNLVPGYRIMDYVQLKMDNRNLYDKLEEKESELTQLRNCCQNTMQILAHTREKSSVIDLDIEKMRDELETTEQEFQDARQQLSYLKRERNDIRQQIKNLRLQYGLLTNQKLLRDMESSVKTIEDMKSDIEIYRTGCSEKQRQIESVRKNMNYYVTKKRRDDDRQAKAEHQLMGQSVSSLSFDLSKKSLEQVRKQSQDPNANRVQRKISVKINV